MRSLLRRAGSRRSRASLGHADGSSVGACRVAWPGWVSTLMAVSLSRSVVVMHCGRAWRRWRCAHPGQMTGMCAARSYARSSWASSPREVMPALVKTLRRWKATVRGEIQHCAATSLFDSPELTSWAILSSVGVRFSQRGRVALAGGLARGAQLLVRPRRPALRRAGPGTSPGPGAGAGGRRRAAGCGAATPRRTAGCEPRRGGDGRARGAPAPPETGRPRRSGRTSRPARRRPWRAPTGGGWPPRTRPAPRPTPRASSGSPARTAASMRSAAAIRASTGRRNRLRWCRAPTLSPAPAARMPLAQRRQVVHRVGHDPQRLGCLDVARAAAGGRRSRLGPGWRRAASARRSAARSWRAGRCSLPGRGLPRRCCARRRGHRPTKCPKHSRCSA